MSEIQASKKRSSLKLRKRTNTLTRKANDLSSDCAVDVLLIIGKRGSRYKLYSSLEDGGPAQMTSLADEDVLNLLKPTRFIKAGVLTSKTSVDLVDPPKARTSSIYKSKKEKMSIGFICEPVPSPIDTRSERQEPQSPQRDSALHDAGAWETRVPQELDAKLSLSRLHETRLCRSRTSQAMKLRASTAVGE